MRRYRAAHPSILLEVVFMSMYYDPYTTLSRNRLFNFVLGPRGNGKSYGAKKVAIKKFINAGKQFVYIRRYDTEMPASQMRNFFDDISVEFQDHEFSSGQGLFRIDGEIAGWYLALSKALMLKSIPFPNVDLIIFDEFIINVGFQRYLPNEVQTFFECYSTISRDRDVPVLFLSNAVTFANPYFIYFNVSLEPGQTKKLTEDISIELIRNEEYTNHVANTRFGKMIAGTKYGDYNMKNDFLLDTDTFVVNSLPKNGHYICTLAINGNEIGAYADHDTGFIFVSEMVDKTCQYRYALSLDDHNMRTQLAKNTVILPTILNAFAAGQMRFVGQSVKNKIYDVLRRNI